MEIIEIPRSGPDTEYKASMSDAYINSTERYRCGSRLFIMI